MRSSLADDAGGDGGKPVDPELGTSIALYSRTYSDTASAASRAGKGWGSARNSASRISNSLTVRQVGQVFSAGQQALLRGLPLNRHITIHWEVAGVNDAQAAGATGKFIKYAGDWIRSHGGRLAWLWVRENGYGKGSHVHMLLHVPKGLSLGKMQRGWLKKITGQAYRADSIRTTRIARTANASATAPALYSQNLAELLGYLVKGASEEAAEHFSLGRCVPGGQVIGKRCGVAQNISPKAELH